MSLMVAYVNFCFDTRDARIAYLKPRNLHRGYQLRIVERAASACGEIEHAFRSQIFILNRLKLSEIKTGNFELKLITLAFRVISNLSFCRPCGQAHV